MACFPSLLTNHPLTSSSENQSKENQTGGWKNGKSQCFCLLAAEGGWRGKSALCSMPWGFSHKRRAGLPDRGLWSAPDHWDRLPDEERAEETETIAGKGKMSQFLMLLWFPTAPAVGLPQTSSLSLQLVMAELGCACHGSEVQGRSLDQSKLSDDFLCWFWCCLALPLCCTQASAPPSHCPHLQVMGSYFSSGGPWGTRSCWLPWVRGCSSCESVRVLCSWHVVLEHLFCITGVALALLVTEESRLLWSSSSAWECAQLTALSSRSARLGWEHSLSCKAFLLLATVCAGVPHQRGLMPLGCLASCLCPISLQII